MTALAEHVRDPALALADTSPRDGLCPLTLACLEELPPPLRCPRSGRRCPTKCALGISFTYAAQAWRQLSAIFGDSEAKALFGLTQVMSCSATARTLPSTRRSPTLVGTVRVPRTTLRTGRGARSIYGEDIPILRIEDPATPRTPSPRRRREQ
ncbi:TraM recognition domain-containing protein [Propioniciclava coleopterorum]|uniref:TraM recognition domain-containing protein n=1 Tax=Propioniciclava coleopterorum TaxID=2714937 RepID=UPI003D751D60